MKPHFVLNDFHRTIIIVPETGRGQYLEIMRLIPSIYHPDTSKALAEVRFGGDGTGEMKQPIPTPVRPLQIKQQNPALLQSHRRSRTQFDKALGLLPVMPNAPAALQAYILADAALVRGHLTPRQRAEVALAETGIKGWADSLSAQDGTGESFSPTETRRRFFRHSPAAASKADIRLGLTQAAVLQGGELSGGYAQLLLQNGFSGEQISEIISSIALNTFSRYFAHAKTLQ